MRRVTTEGHTVGTGTAWATGWSRPAQLTSRARTTLLLSLTLVASLLAPAAFTGHPAAAQDYWQSEYERNQRELREAEAALDALGGDIRVATASLREIDQQLSAMYADLAASQAELDAATLELDLAKRATATANATVEVATERLQQAQQDRETVEERFGDRIIALWKYGTAGYAQAILQSESISEAITQADYVDRVLDGDRDLIADIKDAEAVITEERTNLDKARDTLKLQESTVASAVQVVERLTQTQQVLVDRVEVEQDRRKRILDALRVDENRYQATVAALEAESESIRQELLRSQYAAGAPGKGEFVWPTNGAPGSGYGYRTHPISGQRRMHTGVDIGAPTGQKIVAATDGLVVSAGWRGGYGLTVVIDHGGGVATLYAHQSRLAVAEGQIVDAAETIGYIGSTGYSTGPHLHFEVRVDGSPVDPMDWY